MKEPEVIGKVKVVRRNFWEVLDSDAVIVYQSVVYSMMFVAGVQMLFLGIPKAVDISLDDALQKFWLASTLFGPLFTLLGAACSNKDKYVGTLLQMSGNGAVGFVFAIYITAVTTETWSAGEGVFSPIIFMALSAWSLLLVIRDGRKIIDVERQIAKK